MKPAGIALEEACVIIQLVSAVAFMATMVPNANTRPCWVK